MPLLNFGSKEGFVKSGDIVTGDIIKFVDAGKFVESTKWTYPDTTMTGEKHPKAGKPKVQFQCTIELATGEKRTMTINSTSQRTLADAWGGDTEAWIGKLAKCSVIPTPQGKKAVYLESAE